MGSQGIFSATSGTTQHTCNTSSILIDHEEYYLTTEGNFAGHLWSIIESEREIFYRDTTTQLAHVRPHILRSWQRSRKASVPLAGSPNPLIGGQHLRAILDRNAFFVECADTIIETLLADMVAAKSCIILTDAEGVYLHTTGYSPGFGSGATCPLRGLVSREDIDGTTSMGICLEEQVAVCVLGPEHYSPWYDGWACSSAPIFTHDNELIGTLSLAIERDKFHFHTFRLVVAAARAIREKMLTRRLLHEQQIIMDLPQEAIVMLDRHGETRMMNYHAHRLLGSSGDQNGRPLQDLVKITSKHEDPLGTHTCKIQGYGGLQLHCSLSSKAVQDGGRCIIIREKHLPDSRRCIDTRYTFSSILGESDVMQFTIQQARATSRNDLPVLIQGESGVGKELFAQAMHAHSERRHKPFISLNCGAIPENLIQSELFGYEPGAFTGASSKGATGKFIQAHGGTLFLDEIGDMPLIAQASLLRVLQEREIMRIGGKRTERVDVRIIAATHCDLFEAVRKGTFRQDLYYRLHVLAIQVPPLRDRGEDIVILARHFLRQAARKLDKNLDGLDEAVAAKLRTHPWPGNVRELEHLIYRAAFQATGRILTAQDLATEQKFACNALPQPQKIRHREETDSIFSALKQTGGNVQAAAKLVGKSRVTMYAYIRKKGLDITSLRNTKIGS